jgi:riboflavin synthase alpha subunit
MGLFYLQRHFKTLNGISLVVRTCTECRFLLVRQTFKAAGLSHKQSGSHSFHKDMF